MSRPASFYRWYRGKVWHLGWTDALPELPGGESA